MLTTSGCFEYCGDKRYSFTQQHLRTLQNNWSVGSGRRFQNFNPCLSPIYFSRYYAHEGCSAHAKFHIQFSLCSFPSSPDTLSLIYTNTSILNFVGLTLGLEWKWIPRKHIRDLSRFYFVWRLTPKVGLRNKQKLWQQRRDELICRQLICPVNFVETYFQSCFSFDRHFQCSIAQNHLEWQTEEFHS